MNKKYSQDIIDLVIERIDSQLPDDLKLFVGNGENYSKEELISHVKSGDEVGLSVIKSQMNFLKAVANGTFTKALNTI
jgi:hypothetical protein